jgi:trimeric autotransporter adhesin
MPANNYYRLKSVDIDGKYEYSNTIELTFSFPANKISVYPDPIVDDVVFIESNFKGKNLDICISDLQGRKIYQINKPNSHQTSISTVKLNTGIYILSISDGKGRASKKIIKW